MLDKDFCIFSTSHYGRGASAGFIRRKGGGVTPPNHPHPSSEEDLVDSSSHSHMLLIAAM
eukprot:1196351-Prorocentrum_minimum.AAC.3